MEPTPENNPASKAEMTDNNIPLVAALVPSETATDEQQNLWDAYREQQRRRSCPGCGDDNSIL